MTRGIHFTINLPRNKWKHLWRMVRMSTKRSREEFDAEFAKVDFTYGELTMVCICYHSRNRRPDPLPTRLDAYSLNKMFKALANEIETATQEMEKRNVFQETFDSQGHSKPA